MGLFLLSESGTIQRIDDVGNHKPLLSRDLFDIAIMTRCPESQLLENGLCLWIALPDVSNNHIGADQHVETKHAYFLFRGTVCTPPSKGRLA